MLLAASDRESKYPACIKADLRRVYLLIPTVLSGLAASIAAVVWFAAVAGVFNRPGVAAGAARATFLCFAPFAYIRWVYARRSVLIVNETGLRMRQPFASWSITWSQIASVGITSAWDMTHRGGIAAGVRISLRDGSSCHIPDILAVKRKELAQMIIQYWKFR